MGPPMLELKPWRYVEIHWNELVRGLYAGASFTAYMFLFVAAGLLIAFFFGKRSPAAPKPSMPQVLLLLANGLVATAVAFGAPMTGVMILTGNAMSKKMMDLDEVMFISMLFAAGMGAVTVMLVPVVILLSARLGKLNAKLAEPPAGPPGN